MTILCPYCRFSADDNKALRVHISRTEFCRQKDEDAFDEPDSDIDQEPRTTLPAQLHIDSDDNMSTVFIPPILEADLADLDAETIPITPRKRTSVEEVEDDTTNDPKSVYGDDGYIYAMKFPGPAGMSLNDKPMPTNFEKLHQLQSMKGLEPWTPFQSEKEWELVRWLMNSGVSQKKIDEFCKLKVIHEDIQPSFHNSRSLLQLVDSLERGPSFKCTPMKVQGDLMDSEGKPLTEVLELWHRDPVDVVKELMGNVEFRGHQQYAPVRYFRDKDMKNREYNEMWTCNWWWDTQKKLPSELGTIAPGIIASDQTQLSTFSGDKKAWPVYLSIGNIEKNMRRKPSSRAFLLLGYIPVSKLECFSRKRRSQMGYQLFHDCMKKMLEPLEKAGRDGVKMVCADGYERLVYPLLAAYIADYPEQCLVCCCKENSCPRCTVAPEERGELGYSTARYPASTLTTLLLESREEKPAEFRNQQLRPINPFWRNLPYCNIFECMTPDLLHQLHKGVFGDHVAKWAQSAIGDKKLAEKEIDNRFRTMTPHPNLRHFSKGISSVTQWTGNEYRAMSKVYPGLLAGAVDTRVLEAVRALEDFMFYAHFEAHTDMSLGAMDKAWSAFHERKEVFQEVLGEPTMASTRNLLSVFT